MKSDTFYFGASTSGHQVDGGNNDQWTAWENENAERLAESAEERLGHLPNWQDIKAQACDPANYISDSGIDHKKHYKHDFTLLKKMGLNSFRFSIEWGSIEPKQGEIDEQAVAFYHEYFRELKRRDIEPFVNLWHWSHPLWFEERGGMEERANLEYFENFARFVIDEFGRYFQYMTVLNEPNVYTTFSYLTGEWPPAQKSYLASLRVYRNLIQAHRNVYLLAKGRRPQLEVGSVILLNNAKPKRPSNIIDKLAAKIEMNRWNWWFLDKMKHELDFIGVNYYFTDYLKNFHKESPSEPRNDLGWYMEPGGLEDVLLQTWRRYGKPMIVTETGVADEKDKWRGWWIDETVAATQRAKSKGADVFGYMHWSLLDNFEWAYGWWPKFGLIAVDREKKTMPRTVRKSAQHLKVHTKKSL